MLKWTLPNPFLVGACALLLLLGVGVRVATGTVIANLDSTERELENPPLCFGAHRLPPADVADPAKPAKPAPPA